MTTNENNQKQPEPKQQEPTKPDIVWVFSQEIEARINEAVKKIQEASSQVEALSTHLDNIIVGESSKKKIIVVLLSGSKCKKNAKKDPKSQQIIVIKGTPGGGKTALARPSELFKTKRVGRFTEHALDYSDLEPYDILYIQEIADSEEERDSINRLKFLSSEDGGYTVEFPIKKEGGGFTTIQRTIPPMTMLSTTKNLYLEGQFDRRAWSINVDESREQTDRVIGWKAKLKMQENEVKLGKRQITDYDFSKEVLKRFFKEFQAINVINLMPLTTGKILGNAKLRIRGDVDKMWSFIELYAMFNVKRLTKIEDSDCYAISPEVAMDALRLIIEPMATMISGVDKRTNELFNTLKALGLHKAGSEITKKQRDDVAVALRKSHNTVKSLLNNLCSSGFASQDGKKPCTFTLLYDVETIEEKLNEISLKPESYDDLVSEMRKEALESVNSLSLKRAS